MGLSLRHPGHILPFETESAVVDGDVVIIGSADNKCALPGGASPTTALFGLVMRPDGSTASIGDTVDVVVSGVYPARAGGSITRAGLVTSGGTNGTVIAQAAGSGVIVGIIGQAVESASSGDRVAILVNPFIFQGA